MNFDDIPDKFKINLREETLLQNDSGSADDQRVLIFYSQYTIDLLTKTRYTLINGTFWSVPTLFTQLLTISGSAFGKSIPLVFILLASKEKEIYTKAFYKLKELTGCRFTNVVVDFEIGLKNSVQLVFPESHVFGCSFHFGQMIWRKLQSFSFSQNYLNKCNFNKIIRMFLNLTFVPSIGIVEEFNRLSSCISEEYKILMNQFLKYFQNSFIGSVKKGPLYEIEFWSCNKRVHNNIPCSINSLEAWHRGFNFECRVPHLNLCKFIIILIQEDEEFRIIATQARQKPTNTTKDLKKEDGIRTVCESYSFYYENEFYQNLDVLMKWCFSDE
ncbi:hypothetical protein CDIK_2724 [Cucumispora dikerogammari]|nr:hypothetical protein CDIK_2724 [Cucumispora dikerogammari]